MSDWETDRKSLLDAAAYFEQMKREAEEEVKENELNLQKSSYCSLQRDWQIVWNGQPGGCLPGNRR